MPFSSVKPQIHSLSFSTPVLYELEHLPPPTPNTANIFKHSSMIKNKHTFTSISRQDVSSIKDVQNTLDKDDRLSNLPTHCLPRVSVVMEGKAKITCLLNTSCSLADVIQDLCENHFMVASPDRQKNKDFSEPHILSDPESTLVANTYNFSNDYVLRVCETEELITDDKFYSSKVAHGTNLKLSLSAHLLAPSMCDSLADPVDNASLKKSVFLLQKYLKETEFRKHFLDVGGFIQLQKVAITAQQNTLAYTLGCIHTIIEQEWVSINQNLVSSSPTVLLDCTNVPLWCCFTNEFLEKLAFSLAVEVPGNIFKPITLICIWLLRSSTLSKSVDIFCKYIASQPSVLSNLVHCITSSYPEVQLGSLQLLNSLLTFPPERRRAVLMRLADSFGIRKSVAWLMNHHADQMFHESLIEFQHIVALDYFKGKHTKVDTELATHANVLDEIWSFADISSNGDKKWRLIGFLTETPTIELSRVGVLGLANFHFFICKNRKEYRQFVIDQLALSEEFRCPVARAAIEVCDVLLDVWQDFFKKSVISRYQPLFLLFEELFAITLRAFFRFWVDMDARQSESEIKRVVATLKSHIVSTLQSISDDEKVALDLFYKAMLQTSLTDIRSAQLKMNKQAEMTTCSDYLQAKAAINSSAREFIFQQRILTMRRGDFFSMANNDKSRSKTVRLYKLNAKCTKLMWIDFENTPTRDVADDKFPNHARVRDLIELKTQQASSKQSPDNALPCNLLFWASFKQSNKVFKSIILQTKDSKSPNIIDQRLPFQCNSTHQFMCWLDGLSMLMKESPIFFAGNETERYIHDVADNQFTLWQISQEGLKSPINYLPEIPSLPTSWDFWYDEKCMDPVFVTH
ncbi:hypothetical protein BDV3_004838 [Batrachochytrium dendrobatidis]|uniref:ELMO domain-containing protein n=1 Tax=Batrachochytrium dendrobatidis (strain JEL423) TaxID=403673 RepID=A0A177WKU4_BATDL|nr:hypothetical protein O5D80_007000 [Batrachochytrium dendrobatidis]KAK5671007.1 hypothetical protein QVD99_002773 [Batrachochytrium dendrobatidis]OAJ40304.1 hypothetical protein BDEG_24054 [Batrachochytrium dendrobatidis JEL423]